jgi:hypothetical protein
MSKPVARNKILLSRSDEEFGDEEVTLGEN